MRFVESGWVAHKVVLLTLVCFVSQLAAWHCCMTVAAVLISISCSSLPASLAPLSPALCSSLLCDYLIDNLTPWTQMWSRVKTCWLRAEDTESSCFSTAASHSTSISIREAAGHDRILLRLSCYHTVTYRILDCACQHSNTHDIKYTDCKLHTGTLSYIPHKGRTLQSIFY